MNRIALMRHVRASKGGFRREPLGVGENAGELVADSAAGLAALLVAFLLNRLAILGAIW
jgi:hypothetical protein